MSKKEIPADESEVQRREEVEAGIILNPNYHLGLLNRDFSESKAVVEIQFGKGR